MSDQDFTIKSTYDPSTKTITCKPDTVSVSPGATGKVTVQLEVQTGQPGSIVFQNPPVEWTTPPPADFKVDSTGPSEILITAPNTATFKKPDKEFPFKVRFTYTNGGSSVSDVGDPTIILEGTVGSWIDHSES